MNKIIIKQKIHNFNEAQKTVIGAESPKELATAVVTLVSAQEEIKRIKGIIKEAEKEPKEIIKQLDAEAKALETNIKERFKEVYQTSTVLQPKANNETGEVQFKEKVTDNKGTGVFTFTPEKVKYEIDYSGITQEKYPQFFKEVKEFIIDMEAIKEANIDDLPKKEVITPARVGIQKSKINTIIKGLA